MPSTTSGRCNAAGEGLASNRGVISRFENDAWVALPPPPPVTFRRIAGIAFDAAGALVVSGLQVDGCCPPIFTGKVSFFSGGSWTPIDPGGYAWAFDVGLDRAGALYAAGTDDVFRYSVGKVSAYQGAGVWTAIDPPGFGAVYHIAFDDAGVLYAAGGNPFIVTGRVSRYVGGVWTSMDPPGLAGAWYEAMALDRSSGVLYVADTVGNVWSIAVGSPAQQIANLIRMVAGLHLPAAIAQSLTAKLSAARDRLAAGNSVAARNLLNAFVNEVRAQAGKKIGAADAAALIAAAENAARRL